MHPHEQEERDFQMSAGHDRFDGFADPDRAGAHPFDDDIPFDSGPPLSPAAQQINLVTMLSQELHTAQKGLASIMLSAMSRRITVGLIIDTMDRKAPLWLRGIRVVHGNSRGATKFQVAGEVRVSVETSHLCLSRWRVEAHPISEVTGKTMNGRSHGASGNKSTVTIAGLVVDPPYTELSGEEYSRHAIKHLLEVIE